MHKFIYFLADSPSYPNEIMAKDKAEVLRLVCESVDKESILGIYTEEELIKNRNPEEPRTSPEQSIMSGPGIDDGAIEEVDYASGNDFMVDMMNKALKKATMNEARAQAMQQQATQQPQPAPAPVSVPQPSSAPKFFEDNGTKFKMENGKIYKKVWVDISSGDDAEYRIIKKSTGKPISNKDFVLEKLDWQELA